MEPISVEDDHRRRSSSSRTTCGARNSCSNRRCCLLPPCDHTRRHNTTTQCFHFGKPMVVLPLFWDQHYNAQRVAETGYGVRLQTYEFEDGELLGAIDRLGEDAALHRRMSAIAARVRASPGSALAAGLIEQVAREGTPVVG